MSIRTRGLAYTSRVDQCRPTEFMYASSKFLMLTSDKIRILSPLRFGRPVTTIVSCGEEYEYSAQSGLKLEAYAWSHLTDGVGWLAVVGLD